MTKDEYCRRLYEVRYTAGLNARYHQFLESRYDFRDKAVRVAVAILAIFGLVLAVPKFDELVPSLPIPWIGFLVAILSLFTAIALNIFNVVEKAKLHGGLFRAWSELRTSAVLEEQKTCEAPLEDHHVDRLAELIAKMEALDQSEPLADPVLLLKCQEDENEAEWGKGIRTGEEVKRKREDQQHATSVSGASEASAISAEGPG